MTNAYSNFDFVTFSNYVATNLEAQGRLEQARQADEQVPWGYIDLADANVVSAGSADDLTRDAILSLLWHRLSK